MSQFIRRSRPRQSPARQVALENPATFGQVIEGLTQRYLLLSTERQDPSLLDSLSPDHMEALFASLYDTGAPRNDVFAELVSLGQTDAVGTNAKHGRLVLWQDIKGDPESMAESARYAAELLSELGMNSPDNPTIWTRKAQAETGREDSTSETDQTGRSVSGGSDVSLPGMAFITQSSWWKKITASEKKQSTRLTESQELNREGTGWEGSQPIFREIGLKLNLMPPSTLVALTSREAINDALNRNILDEVYQSLRGTEVALTQMAAEMAPASAGIYAQNIRSLAADGFLEASIDQVESHRKQDWTRNLGADERARFETAAHLLHYAAMYQGARQRVEHFLAKRLESTASRVGDTTVEIDRNPGASPSESMKPVDRSPKTEEGGPTVRQAAKVNRHLKMPIFYEQTGKETRLAIYPDLTSYGTNPDSGDGYLEALRDLSDSHHDEDERAANRLRQQTPRHSVMVPDVDVAAHHLAEAARGAAQDAHFARHLPDMRGQLEQHDAAKQGGMQPPGL